MSIELELQKYPRDIKLKDDSKVTLRPLRKTDEKDFHELFLAIPEPERMFIKHRVTDIAVIHDWCQNIDLGRNLPLIDRKSTRLNSSHHRLSRMPSSA